MCKASRIQGSTRRARRCIKRIKSFVKLVPLVVNALLRAGHSRLNIVDRKPGSSGFQLLIYILYVLHAFSFQPLAESPGALFCINRNAIFPGGASAEDAIELDPTFASKFESFAEFSIADSGGEINKRLGCDPGSIVE